VHAERDAAGERHLVAVEVRQQAHEAAVEPIHADSLMRRALLCVTNQLGDRVRGKKRTACASILLLMPGMTTVLPFMSPAYPARATVSDVMICLPRTSFDSSICARA